MLDITTKLAALLSALKPEDIAALAPARRERLGHLLARWANQCGTPSPKEGVVAQLNKGDRSQ